MLSSNGAFATSSKCFFDRENTYHTIPENNSRNKIKANVWNKPTLLPFDRISLTPCGIIISLFEDYFVLAVLISVVLISVPNLCR